MGLQCGECGWEWPLAVEVRPLLLGSCGAHVGGRAADARSMEILRYQQRHEAAGCKHAEGVCKIGIDS